MELVVESATSDTQYTIDLDGVYALHGPSSEGTFYNYLVGKLCVYATREGHAFDDFIPLHFTAEGHSLSIPGREKTWLRDVTKLAYAIIGGELEHPSTVYLAVLESRFWQGMDFDDIEDWADGYVPNAEDAEEFGKRYFEEHYSSDVFIDVQHHMDWSSYGDEKIDDLTVLEWGVHSHYFES